jgi:hypothetical protein
VIHNSYRTDGRIHTGRCDLEIPLGPSSMGSILVPGRPRPSINPILTSFSVTGLTHTDTIGRPDTWLWQQLTRTTHDRSDGSNSVWVNEKSNYGLDVTGVSPDNELSHWYVRARQDLFSDMHMTDLIFIEWLCLSCVGFRTVVRTEFIDTIINNCHTMSLWELICAGSNHLPTDFVFDTHTSQDSKTPSWLTTRASGWVMWRSPLPKKYWETLIWPTWSSLEYLHTVICTGLKGVRPTKLNSHSPVAMTTGIVRNWRDITDVRGNRACPVPKSRWVNVLFFNSVSARLFIILFLFTSVTMTSPRIVMSHRAHLNHTRFRLRHTYFFFVNSDYNSRGTRVFSS